MQSIRWIRTGALLLAVAFTVTACDEGTSPATDFDAEETAQTVESMTSAVAVDDMENAFGSLENAGMLFSGVAGDVATQSPLAMDLRGIEASEAELAAAVIPAEYHGTTFEWDEGQGYYVASDAAGAPANGVRVIYYAIDPITDTPASPLNALGYVDLTDESTETSNRLGILIFRNSDEATLADYYLDLAFTFTQSSFAFNVGALGFLSNGTDQLNFDVSQGLTMTDVLLTIEQGYSLDLEGTDRAMSFAATITGDPQSQTEDPGTMDAEAMVSNGQHTVLVEIDYANGALTGTISDNGTAVVLMSGDLDNPTFTDTDGNALTQQQLSALHSLWDGFGDMFDFVEELFGFVGY